MVALARSPDTRVYNPYLTISFVLGGHSSGQRFASSVALEPSTGLGVPRQEN
jgi:hypothetical protein